MQAARAELAQLSELTQVEIAQLRVLTQADHQQLLEILRFMHDRVDVCRHRLHRLRSSPDYGRAFDDPEPLVSVTIPTYDNYALLRERSIPSVLGQTYQNFEVVVVGDAAPEEARRTVEAFDDPRITFFNLPYRGPYPEEPKAAWMVAGVPPVNEAIRRARGLWIAPLADDDAFRPRHLEELLDRARGERLELAYGRLAVRLANGGEIVIGRFPPQHGHFGVQAAIYHAGLSEVFEYQLADAAFGIPTDWAFVVRIMRAGVRIGMLDEVTADYYPSRSWTPRWADERAWLDSQAATDEAVTDQSAPRPGMPGHPAA